jgi:outer membrane biosynthesis protein TonB
MATAKKSAPAKKAAPKSAPKAAPKPAPKPSAKPAAKPAETEEAPVPVPARKLEKVAGRETLCQIEIVKDGHVFIARTETDAGAKEYKNTVFEDLLTEMLITLQEQMADH